MTHQVKSTVVAALSLVLGAACAPPATVVTAPAPSLPAPIRGITVEGTGEASGQPDIARVSVGVEARAPNAEAAIGEVNSRMAQVLGALKKMGIPNADLRTTNVTLHYERFPEPPPRPVEEAAPAAPKGKPGAPSAPPAPAPPPQPQGMYRASNMVEVTIRKLDRAGEVLSAATSAGANQLYGIQFELEDPSLLEQRARAEAFAEAKKRAEHLAQLSGVRLGPPQSITEVGRGGSPVMHSAVMMRAEAADVPVERGELKITTTVQVVFGLAQ